MKSSERQVVYFVRNGEMNSSWILAEFTAEFVNVDFNVTDTPAYAVHEILTKCFRVSSQNTDYSVIKQFIDRPGKWLFVSGHRWVHSVDTYDTREQAAEAYKEYLLEE